MIDNRYFCIGIFDRCEEDPKLFVDWFYHIPRVFKKWDTHKYFMVRLGAFEKYLHLEIKWGYKNDF